MRTSLHLMSVGVGALIVFGSPGVSYSQTPTVGQPQEATPTPAKLTSQEIAASSPNIREIIQTLGLEDQQISNVVAVQPPQPSPSTAVAQLPKVKEIAQAFGSDTPKAANSSQTAVSAKPASSEQMPKSEEIAKAFESKPEQAAPLTAQVAPSAQNSVPSPATPRRNPTPAGPTPERSTPLPPSRSPAASPAPSAPSASPTPLNSTTPPTPSQDPAPAAPTPGRTAPAPDYLNPLPNPLQFPTRPEEVRLQGTQPVTLSQAIELAERNNRDLQVARLQLERTQSSLREAQAANSPTLDAQADLSRAQSASSELSQKTQAQRGGLFQSSSGDSVSTTLNGSLQLSYDIFTSGQRSARIRAAERQVRVNELEVERTREELRLNVSSDYYDLQEADEQVRINQAAVRNAEISLRDTQAQERAGLGTRFDVLRSQVNLANSQQQLTNSIATQAVRRRQLAQRISIAESVNLSAADSVVPAGTWTLPIEDSIVLAYKNRAELEQQLVQREVSEQQRRAALASLGPTVSVSAQYNFLDIFEQPVRTTDGYSFGLQARWNLYDGGAAVARARQQEKDKEIAETRFAQNRNNVRFQVEQSYTTLQSNRTNIDTARTALNQAREALRLARLRFQAGVGTQTDVINAETDLTRAEGSLVTAIIGYNRSLAQLQRAVSNIAR